MVQDSEVAGDIENTYDVNCQHAEWSSSSRCDDHVQVLFADRAVTSHTQLSKLDVCIMQVQSSNDVLYDMC